MSTLVLPGLDVSNKSTLELKFTNETAFHLFNTSWGKMNTNVALGINLTKVIPSGNLTCHAFGRFSCECRSVIPFFNFAYTKTFGEDQANNTSNELSKGGLKYISYTPDYNIEHVSCGMMNNRSFKDQIKEAHEFFNDPELASPSAIVTTNNTNYADKDGLIEFIVATELADNPDVLRKLGQQKTYLVAIASIVTDYINRFSERYGQEKKTDIDLWNLALSKIPLMGPSKVDTQTYIRRIKGIEIAKDFIEFIMDVAISQGTAALGSFTKFLEKQGSNIGLFMEENNGSYNTYTLGVTTEVYRLGLQNIYTPKITQYRINFDKQNSKFTTACASSEMVNIHFEYMFAANVFDYEALEDPKIKADFDAFIAKNRKAQILEADTFFSAEFPPVKQEEKVALEI